MSFLCCQMCLTRARGDYVVSMCDVIEETENLLCAVPYIGVVQNWRQEEIEKYHDGKRIAGNVEGSHEGVTSIVDLCPVYADRNQAQSRVHLVNIQVSFTRDLIELKKLTPNIVLTFWLLGTIHVTKAKVLRLVQI